jgi:hypothetical protein
MSVNKDERRLDKSFPAVEALRKARFELLPGGVRSRWPDDE